jgi:hypothetical protein
VFGNSIFSDLANRAEKFKHRDWQMAITMLSLGGQVMAVEVVADQGSFFGPHRQALKNIIALILTILWTRIGHHVDTPDR